MLGARFVLRDGEVIGESGDGSVVDQLVAAPETLRNSGGRARGENFHDEPGVGDDVFAVAFTGDRTADDHEVRICVEPSGGHEEAEVRGEVMATAFNLRAEGRGDVIAAMLLMMMLWRGEPPATANISPSRYSLR